MNYNSPAITKKISPGFLAAAFLLCLGPVWSCRAAVPERSGWTAAASGIQEPGFEAKYAVDGDTSTRWSSPATGGQWIVVDMGKEALLAGLVLSWEAAFPSEYRVELSSDGKVWKKVFSTDRSDGKTDEVYFKPSTARYFRIFCVKRATGYGSSLWEIAAYGPEGVPAVSGAGPEPYRLFDGSGWKSASAEPVSLSVSFPAARPLKALRVDWGENPASDYDVSVSSFPGVWLPAGSVRDGRARAALLLSPLETVSAVRLDLKKPLKKAPFSIASVAFKRADEVTPASPYEIAAESARPGLYPEQFRKRQAYWTLSGLPADHEESALDEYGNFELKAGFGMLAPFIYTGGRLFSYADARRVTQALEKDYLPLPSVTWDLAPVRLRVQLLTAGKPGASVSYLRYTLTNISRVRREARLFLAARPVQINPIWQNGGLSPVKSMELAGEGSGRSVLLNGRRTYMSFPAPSGFGAALFEGGDVMRFLERGKLPPERRAEDPGGMVSGALAFDFALKPGESGGVVVAAPLYQDDSDAEDFRNGDSAAVFAARLAEMRTFWEKLLDAVVFDVPDKAVWRTLKSQLAYILINMDGVSTQPGSRNYKRSWIRDGASTSLALMRFGIFVAPEKYLDWYALRVREDGLVPPVLNGDGTVNTGFGSNLEYDSQGEFLYAFMERYRLTGDLEALKRNFDAMRRAMNFIYELRARTMIPGYMAGEEARERFIGILPKSISHEGYFPPVHSYWDDYWALRGLLDGADAADLLGDAGTAAAARAGYSALRSSLLASIARTMEYKKIAHVPGSAEKGDLDATSTAVLLSACKLDDLLPEKVMRATFEAYYADFRKRLKPGWDGAFTPYEFRSVPAFTALGQRARANELLDYLMGCRRPPAWNHLAEVVNSGYRTGSYIGDMPHTWVGSEFVNGVRQMVVDERDYKLVLLAGAPEKWLTDGTGIRLENLPTHFGKIGLKARLKGRTLSIELAGAPRPRNGIRVHLPVSRPVKKILLDGKEIPLNGKDYLETPFPFKTLLAEF